MIALSITVLRFGFPHLNAYRHQLFDALLPAEATADLGSLNVSWQDFGLQLDVNDLHLEQSLPGNSRITLQAKSASLHCNPFIRFWQTQGCLADLSADSLHIKYTLPNTSVVSQQAMPDPDTLLAPLLEQIRHIRVTNSDLTILKSDATLAAWQIQDLNLENNEQVHRLTVHSYLAQQALLIPLTAQAEFIGPARWSALSGHIYLATHPQKQSSFGTLLPTPLADNVQSLHGQLDFQFWLARDPGTGVMGY